MVINDCIPNKTASRDPRNPSTQQSQIGHKCPLVDSGGFVDFESDMWTTIQNCHSMSTD